MVFGTEKGGGNMMTTFKGEVFCSECGANLALGAENKLMEPAAGKEYIKRLLYLYCPNQNCPLQFKRQELPKV